MRALLIAVTAILFGLLPVASAQFAPGYGPPRAPNYGPGYRPGLSPYLNMLRGGDTAANYYLGTIPEFQRRGNAALFSDRLGTLEGRADGLDRVITTGTLPVQNSNQRYFNNTGGYFPPVRFNRGR